MDRLERRKKKFSIREKKRKIKDLAKRHPKNKKPYSKKDRKYKVGGEGFIEE